MDLRQLRGFGPLDPWPVTVAAKTPEDVAAAAPWAEPHEVARRLGNPAVVVYCKKARTWAPTRPCHSCPQLAGVLVLPSTRRDPETVTPYRVRCTEPVARVLQPSGHAVSPDYAARIEQGAEALRPPAGGPAGLAGRLRAWLSGRRTPGVTREERDVFLTRAHVTSCPRAHAQAGRWLVLAPPCLACPHYRGLVTGRAAGLRRGPLQVLCDHEEAVPLRQLADGAGVKVS